MPTRKQKRRRAKDRRHEWEYVYVDDQGEEVDVDEPETERPKPARATAKAGAKPGAKAKSGTASSRMRKIDPPSWNRVLKRAAIFAPLMFIVVYYVGRNSAGHSVPLAVYYTAVMLVVFVPFTYMIDTMMYRSYRKRIGDPIPPRERRPRAPKD